MAKKCKKNMKNSLENFGDIKFVRNFAPQLRQKPTR